MHAPLDGLSEEQVRSHLYDLRTGTVQRSSPAPAGAPAPALWLDDAGHAALSNGPAASPVGAVDQAA